jgi:hypothetical protein
MLVQVGLKPSPIISLKVDLVVMSNYGAFHGHNLTAYGCISRTI